MPDIRRACQRGNCAGLTTATGTLPATAWSNSPTAHNAIGLAAPHSPGDKMSLPNKPLAGLKVIELESPDGGDPLRKWRKLYEGTSLWWFVQARNKQSITLNLKHEAGREVLRKLLGEADILIENFRPGVLEKLGLGWDVLHALNPKLVMVRLSGFGQTGPMKDQPGFGAVGESMGGLRYITG